MKKTAAECIDGGISAIVWKVLLWNYGLQLRGKTLTADFQFLIEDLAEKAPVVILLDEFDKPILKNIVTPEAREIPAVLKEFYSTIKTCAGKIRFAFVTGVTNFCHVSLGSDLNNLTDISRNADYAAMLGYTQAEFEANFADGIAETEKSQDLSHAEYLALLKEWYGWCKRLVFPVFSKMCFRCIFYHRQEETRCKKRFIRNGNGCWPIFGAVT